MKSNNENKKENKLIPFTLKKIKNNENNQKKGFNKFTDVFMSYNFLSYFYIKEIKEFGKINIKFYNAFVRYYEKACKDLINKYNVNIENEYKPNEIYEQKDDKGHFIKLSFFNLKHYLLFSYHEWAWKNDENYWEKVKSKDSLLNKEIYYLKEVSWIDVKGNISHIFNGKYQLYLNHCVCNLSFKSVKMKILLDNELIEELSYPSIKQVNICRGMHIDKIEDKKEEDIKDEEKKEEEKKEELKEIQKKRHRRRCGYGLFRTKYNTDKRLNKEYIMNIYIPYDEKLDNDSGHTLEIRFEHKVNNPKRGWFIDGVILKKL